MTLTSLIYSSTAGKGLTKLDLKSIHEVARTCNRMSDITGLLVHGNNMFFQVLEGDNDKVRKLFANIARDPRHTDVTLVSTTKIEKRCFGSWSMAYKELSEHDIAKLTPCMGWSRWPGSARSLPNMPSHHLTVQYFQSAAKSALVLQ